MNRFQVQWTDDALTRVAECAATRGKHAEVVSAVIAANKTFAVDGVSDATHISEGLWYRDFDPLRVYLTIDETSNEVHIETVRLLK